MTKLPSIHALRSFTIIAKHRNISRAADELCKTHGAISKQLASLEDFMGADLVIRSSKGIELTYDGSQLLAVSNDIINDISQKIEEVKSNATKEYTVNVTLLPSFAARWLVSHLPDLNKKHPNLNVNLSTSVKCEDLYEENFHLAIRYGLGDWKQYNVIPFIQPKSTPVVGAGCPILKKSKIELDDLLELELFHDCNYDDMHHWFTNVGLDGEFAKKGLFFDDYNIILQSVINGEGMALGRKPLINYDLLDNRLVEIHEASIPSLFKYWIVYPEFRKNDKGLQIFIAWLLDLSKKEGLNF